MVFMVFDLETTGFVESKPYIVSIAFNLYDDETFERIEEYYNVVKPPTNEYIFPQESVNVHGITTEYARDHGVCITEILTKLHQVFDTYSITKIVAHNLKFDIAVLSIQMNRFDKGDSNGKKLKTKLFNIQGYCTMMNSIEMLSLFRTTKTGRRYKKYPKLIELYQHFFEGEEFNAHNARDDVQACFKCYKEMCVMELNNE